MNKYPLFLSLLCMLLTHHNYTYGMHKTYANRMRINRSNSTITCIACDEQFTQRSIFIIHYRLMHSLTTHYTGSKTNKQFIKEKKEDLTYLLHDNQLSNTTTPYTRQQHKKNLANTLRLQQPNTNQHCPLEPLFNLRHDEYYKDITFAIRQICENSHK